MKLSNEIELMLACARVSVDQETEKKIQLLARDKIDWDKLGMEYMGERTMQ